MSLSRSLLLAVLLLGLGSVSPTAAAVRPPREKPERVTLRHSPPAKRAKRPPTEKQGPPVELVHLTTHAHLTLRSQKDSGGFSPKTLQSAKDVLRCHHTGRRHAIDLRLLRVLYATARHFGSDKVIVIAGYRAPRIARQKGNSKSAHKRGVACDFRLDGVRNEAVRDYLRETYATVGIGYYPNAGFVHVDVGRKKAAYWVDRSGPGERARYGGDELPTNRPSPSAAPDAPREPLPDAPGAPDSPPQGDEESGG